MQTSTSFARTKTPPRVASTLRFLGARWLFLSIVTLSCLGFLHAGNALLPPPAPDGDYPGNNTAEGMSALQALTTGTDNTALGFQALSSNENGSYNTATGSFALY